MVTEEYVGKLLKSFQIDNTSINATSIVEELINHTRNEHYLFGGDILEISKFLKRCEFTKCFFLIFTFFSLGEKFAGEKVEDEYARGLFTGHMYSVLDTLVHSKVGWEEISQNKNISKYLKNISKYPTILGGGLI